MKSITEKTLKEINQLERTAISGTVANANDKDEEGLGVKVKIDTSDEKNMVESDIFSVFNQSAQMKSLKIDVKIDEDIEEDSSDAIAEGGEETVMGQGTNPKPEDETYLNLLKKTTPTAKVKVKIN